MTTPTQAQIEAAVWEVLTEWRAEMHDNVKHSLARRIAERIGHFIDRSTTALTAAIGVPDQEHIVQKQGPEPGLLPNGNAAAEVGDDPELDDITIRFQLERIKTLEAELAATIERCAQMAENTPCLGYGKEPGEVVAAAIRALKDKP